MSISSAFFLGTGRRMRAFVLEARVDVGFVILSLVLAAVALLLPAWKLLPQISTEHIPLHYNVYLGIDRYGPWYHVFLPGCVGVGSLLVNVAMQIAYIHRDRVLVRLLSIVTLMLEVVIVVGVFFSTLLNI